MGQSKVLILMTYYERPNLLQIALHSLARQTSDHWFLAFIDDGSRNNPGYPYVKSILSDKVKQTKLYWNNQSPEEKLAAPKSQMIDFLNLAIDECANDNDIIITLADDDALFPKYVEGLLKYYENPERLYSFGSFVRWDPTRQIYNEALEDWHKMSKDGHCYQTRQVFSYLRSPDTQMSWRKCVNYKFPNSYGGINSDDSMRKISPDIPHNKLMCKLKGTYRGQLGRRDKYDKDKFEKLRVKFGWPGNRKKQAETRNKYVYMIGVQHPNDLPHAPKLETPKEEKSLMMLPTFKGFAVDKGLVV